MNYHYFSILSFSCGILVNYDRSMVDLSISICVHKNAAGYAFNIVITSEMITFKPLENV